MGSKNILLLSCNVKSNASQTHLCAPGLCVYKICAHFKHMKDVFSLCISNTRQLNFEYHTRKLTKLFYQHYVLHRGRFGLNQRHFLSEFVTLVFNG